MQKFFIEETYFNDLTLPEDLIYQAYKVLRYKEDDKFIIGVKEENYLVKIKNISLKELKYEIIEKLDINNELDLYVTIIQGYPKGDKFEDIIKHGTELGASYFIPLIMDRTQFKIDDKRQENKLIRFNKIVKEASEQSFRNIVPKVLSFSYLNNIDLSCYDAIFVCYEEEAKNGKLQGLKTVLKELKSKSNIAFIIGPEGGISDKEINYLKNIKNTYFISLGKRILRTETAPLYCLSAVSYERELK